MAGGASAGRVPIGEVVPGQTGYGLTVFAGDRPDTFAVTVLGVQHGARAGGDIIIVELAGRDLERSAVARGMSGSPVYLDDGRLLGAVAFGWPGALRAICGLTPAADLDLVRDRPVVGQATAGDHHQAPSLLAMLDAPPPQRLAALLAPQQEAVTATSGPVFEEAWPSVKDAAAALLPMVTGALNTNERTERLAPLSPGMYAQPAGAVVQAGLAGKRAVTAAAPTLVAGSACAIALVSGDGQLGALGTVSLVEGDRVVMMGHPFMQLGPIDLPLAAASVITVFPSRDLSFKMGSAGPTVGRITHDLRAGLAGTLGERAPTVPVAVTVALPEGRHSYRFDVALQPELTPTLVFWSLYNALLAEGDDRSLQLVRYDLALDLQGKDGRPLPRVALSGVTGGPGGVNALQGDWQTPLAMILGNRHEPVSLVAVDAELRVERPLRAAQIVAVHAPARIAPGEDFVVEVELSARHAGTWRERFTLTAPAGLQPGAMLRLGAASARDFFRLDALRAGGLFEDHSLQAMLELLNRPRSLDELTVALIAADLGFTSGGRELAGLPPSVSLTLASGPPGSARPTLARYLLREGRATGVLLQGDAVRDVEVLAPAAPRAQGVRP